MRRDVEKKKKIQGKEVREQWPESQRPKSLEAEWPEALWRNLGSLFVVGGPRD